MEKTFVISTIDELHLSIYTHPHTLTMTSRGLFILTLSLISLHLLVGPLPVVARSNSFLQDPVFSDDSPEQSATVDRPVMTPTEKNTNESAFARPANFRPLAQGNADSEDSATAFAPTALGDRREEPPVAAGQFAGPAADFTAAGNHRENSPFQLANHPEEAVAETERQSQRPRDETFLSFTRQNPEPNPSLRGESPKSSPAIDPKRIDSSPRDESHGCTLTIVLIIVGVIVGLLIIKVMVNCLMASGQSSGSDNRKTEEKSRKASLVNGMTVAFISRPSSSKLMKCTTTTIR